MPPFLRKFCSIISLSVFLCSSLGPIPTVRAQLSLPVSAPFVRPSLISGLTIHPEDPFKFNFIISDSATPRSPDAKNSEAQKLIKYFLAALTVPEQDMWVNLSPYERNRIVPESFGKTEMGRDLLAQDYMLKQLTASLLSPQEKAGEAFWKKVYAKAEAMGWKNISADSFNKVWIVPSKAVVYQKNNSAFIVDSHLKVMMEKEYKGQATDSSKSPVLTAEQEQAFKDSILPAIEKEVNEGETFANLRQIYSAVILAKWFKENMKKSLLSQVYVDQQHVTGVDHKDPQANQRVYDQYLAAFKNGTHDVFKEEYDPTTQSVIARKYFSGGAELATTIQMTDDPAMLTTGGAPASIYEVQIERAASDDEIVSYVLDIKELGVNVSISKRFNENMSDLTTVTMEIMNSVLPIPGRAVTIELPLNMSMGMIEENIFQIVEHETPRIKASADPIEEVAKLIESQTDTPRLSKAGALPVNLLYVLSYLRENNLKDYQTLKQKLKEDDSLRSPQISSAEIIAKYFPERKEAFKRWMTVLGEKFRTKLMLHSNGNIAPTIAALDDYGIFDLFRDGEGGFKSVTVRDIMEHVRNSNHRYQHPNDGLIHIAMGNLASRGWLKREGESASLDMSFTLTPKGQIGIGLAKHYRDAVQFMPDTIRMRDFLRGLENYSLVTLVEMAKESSTLWHLPETLDPVFAKEVIHELNGYLLIRLMIFMKQERILDNVDQDMNLDIDALNLPDKAKFRYRAAFEIMENAGFGRINGKVFTFSSLGLHSMRKALNGGVNGSYYPTTNAAEFLLFGDLSTIQWRNKYGREMWVERELNILGSHDAHESYFQQVAKIVPEIILRRIANGKIPSVADLISSNKTYTLYVADTGSGAGGFLQYMHETILGKTAYGQLMKDHPELYKIEMIGIDYNSEALDTTSARLRHAGIPHRVIQGDINKPEDIATRLKTMDIPKSAIIHVRSFLDHNRPYTGVKDLAAAEARRNNPNLSKGTFADSLGRAIPNYELEQNLFEHLTNWGKIADEIVIIELSTIDQETAAKNIGRTLAISYDLHHNYSFQLTLEADVFKRIAKEAGWTIDERPEFYRNYPNEDGMTTVTVGLYSNGNETSPDWALFGEKEMVYSRYVSAAIEDIFDGGWKKTAELNAAVNQLRAYFKEHQLEEKIGSLDYWMAMRVLASRNMADIESNLERVLTMEHNEWILLYLLNGLSTHTFESLDQDEIFDFKGIEVKGSFDLELILEILPVFLQKFAELDQAKALDHPIQEKLPTRFKAPSERAFFMLTLANIFIISDWGKDNQYWARLTEVLQQSKNALNVLQEISRNELASKYGLNYPIAVGRNELFNPGEEDDVITPALILNNKMQLEQWRRMMVLGTERFADRILNFFDASWNISDTEVGKEKPEQVRVKRMMESLRHSEGELKLTGTVDEKAKTGGIDFNPDNFSIETQGDTIEMAPLTDLPEIRLGPNDGFIPVIINVTPLPNISSLLKQDAPAKKPELSLAVN
jgi:hypothetical protein